jgi:hypothetical protein
MRALESMKDLAVDGSAKGLYSEVDLLKLPALAL